MQLVSLTNLKENITMKNILKTFGALLMIFLVSCQQTEDFPFQTFDDLEKGAFARLLAPSRAEMFFVLTDGASSSFDIAVEFYDESNFTGRFL